MKSPGSPSTDCIEMSRIGSDVIANGRGKTPRRSGSCASRARTSAEVGIVAVDVGSTSASSTPPTIFAASVIATGMPSGHARTSSVSAAC